MIHTLVWLLTAAMEPTISVRSAPLPTVIVRVDERLDLPPFALLQAQETATEIFNTIGVEVAFASGSKTERQCEPHQYCLLVRISNPPPGKRVTALGQARPFAESGVRIEIFHENVINLLQKHSRFSGRILGHILVHELGHVLARIADHTTEGMMKARWDDADFRRMAVESLSFDARHVRFIHATLDDAAQVAGKTEAAPHQGY